MTTGCRGDDGTRRRQPPRLVVVAGGASRSTQARISYPDWHIPLGEDRMTLGEARETLARPRGETARQSTLARWCGRFRYRFPGFLLAVGAVDLYAHDCIHILLGRGLLPKDEAFALGFTMGSTKTFGALPERLLPPVARFVSTSDPRRFGDEERRVFRDALRLGLISDCMPLDRVEFSRYNDWRLGDVRRQIRLERELLIAYYAIERRRYPASRASQRLLSAYRAPRCH